MSPSASSPRSGAAPSPYSEILPSIAATQPRAITRSASTRHALVISSAWSFSCFIACSCGGRERAHVDQAIRDRVAHVEIVHDRQDRGAAALALIDQPDDGGAVF